MPITQEVGVDLEGRARYPSHKRLDRLDVHSGRTGKMPILSSSLRLYEFGLFFGGFGVFFGQS
jgi:hypothetical protein